MFLKGVLRMIQKQPNAVILDYPKMLQPRCQQAHQTIFNIIFQYLPIPPASKDNTA